MRGNDACKRVVGKNRHVLVAPNGFLSGIAVTEASIQGRDEARDLLGRFLVGGFGYIRRIWADGGH